MGKICETFLQSHDIAMSKISITSQLQKSKLSLIYLRRHMKHGADPTPDFNIKRRATAIHNKLHK